jgi:fumarylacetoacetase
MAEEQKAKKPKVEKEPRKSWVSVPPDSDFPIQNLPWGVFKPTEDAKARPGVAIGDHVLDLSVLHDAGLFRGAKYLDSTAFTKEVLNDFMAQDKAAWTEAREIISDLLDEKTGTLRDDAKLRSRALHDRKRVKMVLPARIGDYTDFYSSKNHAYNVGVMFRGPENALQPNYLWLPVGYHGRSSSVVLSGVDIHRPQGQISADEKTPTFEPCKLLDFELELGFFLWW